MRRWDFGPNQELIVCFIMNWNTLSAPGGDRFNMLTSTWTGKHFSLWCRLMRSHWSLWCCWLCSNVSSKVHKCVSTYVVHCYVCMFRSMSMQCYTDCVGRICCLYFDYPTMGAENVFVCFVEYWNITKTSVRSIQGIIFSICLNKVLLRQSEFSLFHHDI